MTDRTWYSKVSDPAFAAFIDELARGPWADADVSEFDLISLMVDDAMSLPVQVYWKLRLLVASHAMAAALAVQAGDAAKPADDDWDGVQDELEASLALYATSRNADKAAAARRLRQVLLQGATGRGQTKASYTSEVDWGRTQVRLATQDAQVAADIALLGLGGMIDEVRRTTEALALVSGTPTGRTVPLKAARLACRAAYEQVHAEIAARLAITRPGTAHDLLQGLLAPLQALLARFQDAAPSSATPQPTPPTA